MYNVIILTENRDPYSAIAQSLLSAGNVKIQWIDSVSTAEKIVTETTPNLMVIDERVGSRDGIDIARNIIMKNAMINLVLVSSLDSNTFHEASEGLGIVAQLPPFPEKKHAIRLLEILNDFS